MHNILQAATVESKLQVTLHIFIGFI